jgi:CCR4-NOT transcription complex subunit 2
MFANMRNPAQNSGGQSTARQAPIQSYQSQRTNQGQQPFAADFGESQSTQSPDDLSLSHMSEIDKFGLKGLLALIRHESADIGALAVGQDLTQLGLDLNQPE